MQQPRGVTGKPVRLADPPSLAGRENLLAEMHTRLTDGADAHPRTVALSGLGGVGKTSLALAYARRHLAEVGVAWQFAAEDPTVLAAGFSELAAQLGVRDLADTRDPVASVHGTLAVFPGPWLLIFDNAPDRASVAEFLPPAGLGRVLITSRNHHWPPGLALEVPVLDLEVAAEFLVKRTEDPDRQAAAELAGQLGGLPLALEQAAAYMQASGGTLAGYLASFQRRRTHLLARGEPTGYSQTVATTWGLAFKRLQHDAPAGIGLLRLLAHCAPEAIPLRLLLRPRSGLGGQFSPEVAPMLLPLLEDSLAAGDAIAALRRYSLVTPAGAGLTSVHRLVQAITLDQMSSGLAEAWRQATAAVIEAALPAEPGEPASWPEWEALLPHALAVVAPASVGMARIAMYLGFRGNASVARDLQEKVVDARERILGPVAMDTLYARIGQAYRTGLAGDVAGALSQSAALLPTLERALGPEHPYTLATRDNLAVWTGKAGDPVTARDLYAALLPVEERVLGREHWLTLNARDQLAHWTGYSGDAASARDQYSALLPVQERVLGAEHPHTLTARGNLAYWIGQAGDPAAARDQVALLLPIRARVLGAEHPSTLEARGNLAYWTGRAGDPAGARDQFALLLPVDERALGPQHPETRAVRNNLADLKMKTGGNSGTSGSQLRRLT